MHHDSGERKEEKKHTMTRRLCVVIAPLCLHFYFFKFSSIERFWMIPSNSLRWFIFQMESNYFLYPLTWSIHVISIRMTMKNSCRTLFPPLCGSNENEKLIETKLNEKKKTKKKEVEEEKKN